MNPTSIIFLNLTDNSSRDTITNCGSPYPVAHKESYDSCSILLGYCKLSRQDEKVLILAPKSSDATFNKFIFKFS